MKFRTQYEDAKKRESIYGTVNNEESLTVQDAEDSDINIIMKKYAHTGTLPIQQMQALLGDFSEIEDFRQAQERIREANDAFSQVPADLRKRFDNDPQKFIDFVLDDKNLDETVKLGYRMAPPKPATPTGTETPVPAPPKT
ncbi:VP3 [Kummerowia striata gokushovirus]|nr:VP3 [Kummerowia striata gokushovirus]